MNTSNIKTLDTDTQDQKIMHENIVPETILSFDKFIDEIFVFSNSKTNDNLPMSSEPKIETRQQDIQNAAWKHVVAGNHKAAFDAAYKAAHAHAKADLHDNSAAHEIATRKAKFAVKTATDAVKKK